MAISHYSDQIVDNNVFQNLLIMPLQDDSFESPTRRRTQGRHRGRISNSWADPVIPKYGTTAGPRQHSAGLKSFRTGCNRPFTPLDTIFIKSRVWEEPSAWVGK
jgi:hypothetical protein